MEQDISRHILAAEDVEFLDQSLGEGSYGRVIVGRYEGSLVAVKVLTGQLNARELQEWAKEIQVMTQLHSQRLVRVFGGINSKPLAIVTELMPKGNLYSLLRNNESLPWTVKVQIALDVAYGLSYLHRSGILHRDLKSLNILLDRDLRAKICDFGLAKVKEAGKSSSTMHQGAVGSVLWMSPEIMPGACEEDSDSEGEEEATPTYTVAGDVYAFSMVLVELMTHKMPFEDYLKGRHPLLVMPRLLRKGKRPKLPLDAPQKLKALAEHCWQQSPDARPSAKEVAAALEVLKVELSNASCDSAASLGQSVELQPAAISQESVLQSSSIISLSGLSEKSRASTVLETASQRLLQPPSTEPVNTESHQSTERQQGEEALAESDVSRLIIDSSVSSDSGAATLLPSTEALQTLARDQNGETALSPSLTELRLDRIKETVARKDWDTLIRVQDRVFKPLSKRQIEESHDASDLLLDLCLDYEWLQFLAEKGQPSAMHHLGICYELGKGVSLSLNRALEWYQRAADAGEAEAAYFVASFYEQGIGVEANAGEAGIWLRKAAERGHVDAQFRLGKYLSEGNLLPRDAEKAFQCYLQAANGGHTRAQLAVSDCYYKGEGVQKNKAESLIWLERVAQTDDVEAQYMLADRFAKGDGTISDLSVAVLWFRRASDAGHASSMWRLAQCYAAGKGVPRDLDEALRFLRRSAAQRHSEAAFELAEWYREGRSGSPDEAEATKWLVTAAELGHAFAQFQLAEQYRQGGGGVDQSLDQCLVWYRRSAEQGFAQAQRRLGEAYHLGDLVENDDRQALQWYLKAADQNDTNALFAVGQFYTSDNTVVTKNEKQSFRYFFQAATQGHEEAQFLVGEAYLEGKDVVANSTEGMKWLRAAAEKGHVKAQYSLAEALSVSSANDREAGDEAVKWYRKAASQGCCEAQLALGRAYKTGSLAKENAEEAMTWLAMAADAGQAEAQYLLAECYSSEDRNSSSAFGEYSRAAAQGHLKAKTRLGWCYARGEGTSANKEEAVKQWGAAAEKGEGEAQYQLGLAHSEGEGGLSQNDVIGLHWFVKAADQGIVDAQYEVAERFRTGRGQERDFNTAFHWFSKAAAQGHREASYRLALCLANGEGVQKDESAALEWFEKAANENHPDALYRLGGRYASMGQPSLSVGCYRRAAQQGHVEAQRFLGDYYVEGKGVERDPFAAAEWYRKAAEKGDAAAQAALGALYSKSEGVEEDVKEAVKWLNAAAEKGDKAAERSAMLLKARECERHRQVETAVEYYRKAAEAGGPEAQYRLASLCAQGRGTAKDVANAVSWYAEAAEAGHLPALIALGDCYAKGIGQSIDSVKAFELYNKAAERGSGDGWYALGQCFLQGQGTAKNPLKAFEAFFSGYQQNHAGCQYMLGRCYAYRVGVKQDKKEALRLFELASEQSYAEAEYKLASWYSEGKVVSKSKEKALEFYCRSAEHGSAVAQFELGSMYANGRNVPKNEHIALQWYRRSADQSHPEALAKLEKRASKASREGDPDGKYDLAICLLASGNAKKLAEAAQWLREAAAGSHVSAQEKLAGCYRLGRGASIDDTSATRWEREAAKRKKLWAKVDREETGSERTERIGVVLTAEEVADAVTKGDWAHLFDAREYIFRELKLANDVVPAIENLRKNRHWLEYAVARRYAPALFLFGQHFCSYGSSEQLSMYEEATSLGDADAQYAVAEIKYYGHNGVEKSKETAFELYYKAACQGLIKAQSAVGYCYYYGTGVSRDLKESAKWYLRAAEKGYVAAQRAMGELYATGTGVDKDRAKALKWYRAAAEGGCAYSQTDLGNLYYEGTSSASSPNYSEAAKWYRKAAEAGWQYAQHSLGVCYLNGHGIEADVSEARRWLRKAAAKNHEGAKELLEKIEKEENVISSSSDATQTAAKMSDLTTAAGALSSPIPDTDEVGGSANITQTTLEERVEPLVTAIRNEMDTFALDTEAESGSGAYPGISYSMETLEKALDEENWELLFGVQKQLFELLKEREDSLDSFLSSLEYCEQWLLFAAKKGSPDAMYRYAMNACDGDDEIRTWLRKAADLGHAGAQFEIGCQYEYGERGVKSDEQAALHWYTLAATQGHLEAQNTLVRLYSYEGDEESKALAVKWCRAAIAQNSSEAMTRMGDFCLDGYDVSEGKRGAVQWYLRAAEGGDRAVFDRVRKLYEGEESIMTDADKQQFVKWMRKSAEGGDREACHHLGLSYESGDGVENVDEVEAAKWYRKAAENGWQWSQYRLGLCYLHGRGVEKDRKEALQWLQKAAEKDLQEAVEALKEQRLTDHERKEINLKNQGKKDAKIKEKAKKSSNGDEEKAEKEFLAGEDLYYGHKGVKNTDKAIAHYLRAADKGHLPAKHKLGWAYYYDRRDYKAAFKWFKAASDDGFLESHAYLAGCYANGEGVKQNGAKVVETYRKGALQGCTSCCCKLGEIYYGGTLTKRDYDEAVKWLREAAAAGYSTSQELLAMCFEEGHGVKKDKAVALRWYHKSAESGWQYAQYDLALRYLEGRDVEKSISTALSWLKKAAAKGLEKAQVKLKELKADVL